jgi:flavodoxin
MTEQQSIRIICISVHHDNTKTLSKALAEVLDAKIYSVDEATALDTFESDVVGVGSGIYFARHHRSLLQLVDSWPTRPCRVFIFSTAGLPFLRWLQHCALRRRLVRRGFTVVGEFCCRGWDTVGPLWLLGGINRRHPNEKDLERARRFARQLLEKLRLPGS